jgi:hypothetical protein
MRGGKEDVRIIGEKGFLRADVLYPRTKYRSRGRVVAQGSNVGWAKRALPDEPFLLPHGGLKESMMRRHLTSSIKSKPCGWTLRITVTGELDLLTSIRLRSHFDQALPSTKAIELDLREVAFMDSAGV